MRRTRVPELVAPLGCLALFYLSLFAAPPRSRDAPWLLTAEESQRELERSRALIREGQPREALEITRRLHRAFPESHVHLHQIATLEEQLGDPLAAARAWEAYLDLSPTPLEACPAVGRAWQAAGRETDALDAYERCLAFDPENPDSHLYLALARERRGLLEGAEALFRQGVALAPDYPDLVVGLARVRLRRGDRVEARRGADEAMERWPDNPDVLLLGGLLARATGDLQQARRLLLRGAELAPAYADIQAVLGGIAEQQGDAREAARRYDEVLRLEPGNAAVRERRARLGVPGGA
jgi:tetratricopeptide (TPR) repeat protein